MTEKMNLNTRIVYSLMDMGPGEIIEHGMVAVEAQWDGADKTFTVWDDGDKTPFDDVNLAADFIEERVDDWPAVEPRDVISAFSITITQDPNVTIGPSVEDIERAVGGGLVRMGARGIKNIDVKQLETHQLPRSIADEQAE